MMETENFDGFSAADLGDLKPVRRNPDKRFPFPAVRFSKYKNISRGFFNVHTQKEFNPRYFRYASTTISLFSNRKLHAGITVSLSLSPIPGALIS